MWLSIAVVAAAVALSTADFVCQPHTSREYSLATSVENDYHAFSLLATVTVTDVGASAPAGGTGTPSAGGVASEGSSRASTAASHVTTSAEPGAVFCSREIVIDNVMQQMAGDAVSSPANLSLSHVVFLQASTGQVEDIAEFVRADAAARCVAVASPAMLMRAMCAAVYWYCTGARAAVETCCCRVHMGASVAVPSADSVLAACVFLGGMRRVCSARAHQQHRARYRAVIDLLQVQFSDDDPSSTPPHRALVERASSARAAKHAQPASLSTPRLRDGSGGARGSRAHDADDADAADGDVVFHYNTTERNSRGVYAVRYTAWRGDAEEDGVWEGVDGPSSKRRHRNARPVSPTSRVWHYERRLENAGRVSVVNGQLDYAHHEMEVRHDFDHDAGGIVAVVARGTVQTPRKRDAGIDTGAVWAARSHASQQSSAWGGFHGQGGEGLGHFDSGVHTDASTGFELASHRESVRLQLQRHVHLSPFGAVPKDDSTSTTPSQERERPDITVRRHLQASHELLSRALLGAGGATGASTRVNGVDSEGGQGMWIRWHIGAPVEAFLQSSGVLSLAPGAHPSLARSMRRRSLGRLEAAAEHDVE